MSYFDMYQRVVAGEDLTRVGSCERVQVSALILSDRMKRARRSTADNQQTIGDGPARLSEERWTKHSVNVAY
jgi:hypothetical protein